MPNTSAPLFDIILFAGIEDYTPLYMVFLEASPMLPSISVDLKKEKFKRIVASMIEQEVIQICIDTNPDGKEGILFYSKEEALTLIHDKTIFEPKSRYGDNLCISTTSKGEALYQKKEYGNLSA
jgi:hypothetical protein